MSNQLFFLSLADIFSVYPSIFSDIIASPHDNLSQIHLPSDADWQEKMYYRLLDVQRRVNESTTGDIEFEEVNRRQQPTEIFDPLHVIAKLSPSPNGPKYSTMRTCAKPRTALKPNVSELWTLPIVTKAALLLKQPLQSAKVQFQNEHEMRKVYSLIYDVFRYKKILSQALDEVGFFKVYPQYTNDINRIWLMLYDLFVREFKPRNFEHMQLERVSYEQAQVQDIADCLWNNRTRLAASISRMRIKCGALRLSQLLPVHLQNEKVAIAAANPVISGWINPFLITTRLMADKYLEGMGLKKFDKKKETYKNDQNYYIWDNICPLCLSCIPTDRNEFAKSELIMKQYFVMQDRQFSYGPALMAKLMQLFELDGDILQTHISSPRSTAYLAALFHSVNRVNNFYVYGAGEFLVQFRDYMQNLGVNNIKIFAESFTSYSLEAKRLGSVVGILANPPNSFSAIGDPIDLICSRGGDLSMLEVLTETEISEEGRERVALILREQLHTLQMAMSRPQIQFILYQTHSVVHSENEDMVGYCIDYINNLSLQKHRAAFRERKRLEALAEAEIANIPSAAGTQSPRKRIQDEKSKSSVPTPTATGTGTGTEVNRSADVGGTNIQTATSTTINDSDSLVLTTATTTTTIIENEDQISLPECDEFINEKVPDICLNQDNCLNPQSSGCFLSLIRRRDITRLNAKYLIKMAELRGLFGKTERAEKVPKIKPIVIKQQESHVEKDNEEIPCKSKPTKSNLNVDTLIGRLMQATNASKIRNQVAKVSAKQHNPIVHNNRRRECTRYLMPASLKLPMRLQRIHYWWHYAFRCVLRVRQSKQIRGFLNVKAKKHRYFAERIQLPLHINELKINM